MTQTWWLSFTDPDRPAGDRFLGVCIVEVDDDDAADARQIIAQRFPRAKPGAEWTAAATRKAHAMGCNPGGDIASVCMDGHLEDIADVPRDRLLSRAELEALGVVV